MSIKEAVQTLCRGGLVVYPTETAYGLGCDSRNAGAVRAIYRMKKRSAKKPLAVIAASLPMVRRYFDLTPEASRLAREHWPGPLTLVLPVKHAALRRALGLETVGVRISPHPVARALSAGLGAPIVSTSANASGAGPVYSMRAVVRSLGRREDVFLLDTGALPRRRPSTVVIFEKGKPVVVRKGPVKIGGRL